MVRECVADRRAQARARGLCARCCKNVPKTGSVTCAACNASALERVRRMRKKRRATIRNRLQEVHERAGDVAHQHSFHGAAAQHYQDALSVEPILPIDHDRISEKLVQALFLTDRPEAANPWYDRLLASHLATPGNGAKAVRILLRVATQLWMDSKTKEALPVISRALALAEMIADAELQTEAHLKMSNYFHLLGRYEEAAACLKRAECNDAYPTWLRSLYYDQQALRAAAFGKGRESYRQCELAISMMRDSGDLFRVVGRWQNYAYCAQALGDIRLAKSCAEHALLLCRQNRFLWYIPYVCLGYADVLTHMGQYDSAFDYLLEALSYDTQVPLLERKIAQVGIPIALHMHDKATLAKCARPRALSLAFQSGQPEWIGPVAAAFARLYETRKNQEQAQAILHRAIEATGAAPYGWHLPLEVARHGDWRDVPRARSLLETCDARAGTVFARACLNLFDAWVARRGKDLSATRAHAWDAMKKFEVSHFYAYANEARSLLPPSERVPDWERPPIVPLMDMQSVLTPREREVVGLVIQGLTNRAVALELSITENTVEKHMTSIMNQLGLRSRHQLAGAIGNSGESAARLGW